MEETGVALFDTAMEVIRQRGNASDQFLEIVTPVDLDAVLKRIPECKAIVTTGQKATDTLLALVGAGAPKVGGFSDFGYKGRALRLYRMPSSSRAYPKPLEDKVAEYRVMFHDLGML
ncbi:MAG: uracil-DNA glycosylase family protein [Butyricimonas faecihominis]